MATQEIWELTVPGRVSVIVQTPRGGEKTLQASGKGGRLRISAEDRELNDERIRKDELNPFTNGMLVRVDAGAERSEQALPDDELMLYFDVTGSDFEAAVVLLSETNVRRLRDLTTVRDASRSQSEFLDEHIAITYPIGGTVPSYDEMRGDPVQRPR